VKLSQLIVAAGVCGACFVGLGDVAHAAPTANTCEGSVVVPVELIDVEASVGAPITCDITPCAEGVLTTITDDSGVQQQACVASAAVESPVAPAQSTLVTRSELPATGTGMGGLIIAALLVGSGSVASLLSRRKTDRS
jgi:LPXTG-motif cell wall-anchored protein